MVPPGHALRVDPANALVPGQVARVQAPQVGGDARQAVGAVAVGQALGVGGWQGKETVGSRNLDKENDKIGTNFSAAAATTYNNSR